MEQEEVINLGLAIWVVEYSLHKSSPPVWKADGVALDGYHGFGDSKSRYFDGEVVLLSSHDKFVQHLSVSSAHFSRGGFKWLIRGAECLPETPFLITGDLAIQIIFDGYVQVSETQDVIDTSELQGYMYCVAARNWFGVMRVKDNQKVHLLAFSSNNVTVSEEDDVWSPEWDCLIGKLKII